MTTFLSNVVPPRDEADPQYTEYVEKNIHRLHPLRWVHKAFRAMTFQIGLMAQTVDWANEAEATRFLNSPPYAVFFQQYPHHGHIEDTFMLPVLEEKAPHVRKLWEDGHKSLDESFDNVLAAAKRVLEAKTPQERRGAGHRFIQKLNLFIAANLIHMNGEETELTAILWQTRTDEEIAALGRKIGEVCFM